jgi:hypothetical protein
MFCAHWLIFGDTDGALGPVFMFCTYKLIFDGTKEAGSSFMFCAPEHVFSGIERVGSSFHVLLSQTHFWRYRGRWVQFSCFLHSGSFSAVPRAPSQVLMFCSNKQIFGGTDVTRYGFHVLRCRIRFGSTEDIMSNFLVLHSRTRFRRFGGCGV